MNFYIIPGFFHLQRLAVFMLKINRTPALSVFRWMGQAWRILQGNFGTFVGVCFLYMMLQIMPFLLGTLLGQASIIFTPVIAIFAQFFACGIYTMIVGAMYEQPIRSSDVWIALKDKRKVPVIVTLSVINLLGSLLLSGGLESSMTSLQESLEAGTEPDSGAVLLIFTSVVFYTMLFFYTLPVAWFTDERRIGTMFKVSLIACLINLLPLTIFAIVAGALIMMSSFMLMLPVLVFAPWLMITYFLSFREIIQPLSPDSDQSDDSSQPPSSGNDDIMDA